MHDQCLCEQALQEPVSVRLGNILLCSFDPIVEPIEAEGAHVDSATGRTQHDNETQKVLGVPALGSD